jgi:hypothetical protein
VDSRGGLAKEKAEALSRLYGAKYILELKRGWHIARNARLASFEDAPDFVAMGNFRQIESPKLSWATQIDLL